MPAALQITSRLYVTSLFNIYQPSFAKLYCEGVYWSLFKERCTSPLTDHYMLDNIKATLNETNVDGQLAYQFATIGFHFGRLHGAILSAQTGQLRQDVTTLANFQSQDAARGYDVGREYYFLEAEPHERIFSDEKLIQRLQETECESVAFHDEEGTWYYTLGCLLGELSGQLFPSTSKEFARWKAANLKVLAEYEREKYHETNTEPLDIVSVVEYIS